VFSPSVDNSETLLACCCLTPRMTLATLSEA